MTISEGKRFCFGCNPQPYVSHSQQAPFANQDRPHAGHFPREVQLDDSVDGLTRAIRNAGGNCVAAEREVSGSESGAEEETCSENLKNILFSRARG